VLPSAHPVPKQTEIGREVPHGGEVGHVRHRNHRASDHPRYRGRGSGIGQAIRNFKTGLASKDEIDVTPKKEEVREGKPGGSS
jgi:hypothetical protein